MGLRILPLTGKQSVVSAKKSTTFHVALCHPALASIVALIDAVLKGESQDYAKDLGEAKSLVESPAFWLGIGTEERLQSGRSVQMVDKDGKPTLNDCSVWLYTGDPERERDRSGGEKAGLLLKAQSFNPKFPVVSANHPYWVAALAGYRAQMGVPASTPVNAQTQIPVGTARSFPPQNAPSALQEQIMAAGDIEVAAK